MSERRQPPRLLLAWEALPAHTQLLIAFPVLFVLLFAVHMTLLNQPLGRGLAYGVFWAALATGAIVAATRNEAARRRREAQQREDETGGETAAGDREPQRE
jgi:hypothetical protein